MRWRTIAGKDVLANLENAPALRGAHNANAAAATAVLGACMAKDLQQLEDLQCRSPLQPVELKI